MDGVDPVAEPLRFFGAPQDHELLPWAWAESRLVDAATYWVAAPSASHPHPRPVWGVWLGAAVHLSLGAPALRRDCVPGAPVTVHPDNGLEVVIVEGTVRGPTADAEVVAAYDDKYAWAYDLEQFGPFTTVDPARVLAWRAAGEQGRDGFVTSARFRFDDDVEATGSSRPVAVTPGPSPRTPRARRSPAAPRSASRRPSA